MPIRRRVAIGLMGLGFLALGACAPIYKNYGYIPPEEELAEIAVGVDTKASVEDSVGPPSSGGVLDNSGYYYVRSRMRTIGFAAPQVIEREVLAISFDSNGVVSNIERFGLEDGRVVPITRRVTETSVDNRSFVRRLLGNIGRVGPSGLGG